LGCLNRPESNPAEAVHHLEGLLLRIWEQQNRVEPVPQWDNKIRGLMRAVLQDPSRVWDFHVEALQHALSYSHFRRLFRQAATARKRSGSFDPGGVFLPLDLPLKLNYNYS
jgi:hypothetical protein